MAEATVFLRRPQVEQKTGLSRSSIYALVKAGTFPAPIRLGSKSVAWVEQDVERWQAARIADSRTAAA